MIFQAIKSGKSVEGKEIKAYKSEFKAKTYLYLIAGVHGDEVEGVYVMEKLFSWLKQQDFEIPMIVIPIVNMDGYANQSRVNSNAVDLNRNLPTEDWDPSFKEDMYNPGKEPLSEPENRFLVDTFKKFPPNYMISFHSWKPILNINGGKEEVAQHLAKFNNYPVQDDIGYPTPGSMGTYLPANYQAPVLTFECPRLVDTDLSLKDIWEENEKGLKDLFNSKILH